MPTEVIMPALGMSQDTGRLIAWKKQEGDPVQKGEILMEVETDKTTVEVEAAASGILGHISAQEGSDVPVGSVIALILAPGETPAPSNAASDDVLSKSAASTQAKRVHATPVALRAAEQLGVNVEQIPTHGKRITRADVETYASGLRPAASGRRLASPKARRLASERGIDLAALAGSGPNGAVLARDIQAAPAPPQSSPSQQNAVPAGSMWQRMAERLTQSWQTVPHFYLKTDVNAQALVAWRQSISHRTSAKVTYTDLLVRLVAGALRSHPHVNGQWVGDRVTFNEQINIGLAVATDEGLLVPVIHAADTQGIIAIAERRRQLTERARNKRLQPDDLTGGTFTISNLGMFGVDEFNAIINPPQAAILAVGRIADRVVPVDGQAAVRPMMTLNLSCDHRAVDGARAAQFLDTLTRLIHNPVELLD